MTEGRSKPGEVRDAIIAFLSSLEGEASVAQIRTAVTRALGRPVPPSSIRSYLNLNHPTLFTRTRRGYYRLTNR